MPRSSRHRGSTERTAEGPLPRALRRALGAAELVPQHQQGENGEPVRGEHVDPRGKVGAVESDGYTSSGVRAHSAKVRASRWRGPHPTHLGGTSIARTSVHGLGSSPRHLVPDGNRPDGPRGSDPPPLARSSDPGSPATQPGVEARRTGSSRLEASRRARDPAEEARAGAERPDETPPFERARLAEALIDPAVRRSGAYIEWARPEGSIAGASQHRPRVARDGRARRAVDARFGRRGGHARARRRAPRSRAQHDPVDARAPLPQGPGRAAQAGARLRVQRADLARRVADELARRRVRDPARGRRRTPPEPARGSLWWLAPAPPWCWSTRCTMRPSTCSCWSCARSSSAQENRSSIGFVSSVNRSLVGLARPA